MSAKVFWETYESCLLAAVKTNPADFSRAAGVDPVAYAKGYTEVLKATPIAELDIQCRGFYMTCKKLGINHGRKAIKAYLEKP